MDIFCKIAKHEIPAKIRFEDDRIVAFDDINPKAPIHILIIPKKHLSSIGEMSEEYYELIGHIVFKAKELAQGLGLDSYRLVTNTGEEAGQSVPHLHFHLLGGKPLGDIVSTVIS